MLSPTGRRQISERPDPFVHPSADAYFFRIADNSMGMATCSDEAGTISAVIEPIYGNRAQGCNATNSFL